MVWTRMGRAAWIGVLAGVVGLSCAKGESITGGTGGVTTTGSGTTSGTETGTGGGVPGGLIGSPCQANADCKQGTCTPVGSASYCTQACPPTCPEGTYCSLIDGNPICVPDLDQQCARCSAASDCKLPSDACLTAPLGDSFCARDCSVDGLCPNGFTCLDLGTYADAGAPDGGPAAGQPSKWCVPNNGYSCPCNDKRDGATRACQATTSAGTCPGTETCDGKSGAWTGCTAGTPVAEICNGKDDDCNGQVDDGDPNAMCAALGQPPAHSSWVCKSGECKAGPCNPGWTTYPTGAEACSCAIDANEPNGSCLTASPAGSVADNGAPITLTGTLANAIDVDLWTFDTVDADEGSTNSYHVSIAFTSPAPNDEFLMDVIRGDTCDDAPTGPGSAITAYDWCVNGNDGASPPTGEANCGPAAPVHCGGTPGSGASGTHSAKYWVRVYRKPGATGSCTPYTITVSANAAGCDFTQKCQ